MDGQQLNVRVSVFSSWDHLVEFVNHRSFLASAWHAQLEYSFVAAAFDAELDVAGDEAVDFYCSMGDDRCEQYEAMHGSIDCHPVLAEAVSSLDVNERTAIRDELTTIAGALVASVTPALETVPCPDDADQRDVEFDTSRTRQAHQAGGRWRIADVVAPVRIAFMYTQTANSGTFRVHERCGARLNVQVGPLAIASTLDDRRETLRPRADPPPGPLPECGFRWPEP